MKIGDMQQVFHEFKNIHQFKLSSLVYALVEAGNRIQHIRNVIKQQLNGKALIDKVIYQICSQLGIFGHPNK